MTQTPEEWTIAAFAKRRPGIEIGPLRPASLKPYQEAIIREMLDSTSTTQVTVMATRIGGDPRWTLRAREIDTAAAAEAALDRRADAFAEWAKEIPFIERPDPEAKCRRIIGPDGLWMLEVGGAA